MLQLAGFFVGVSLNHRIRNGKHASEFKLHSPSHIFAVLNAFRFNLETEIYDAVSAPLTLKKSTSGGPVYPVDLMPRRLTDNMTESSEGENNHAASCILSFWFITLLLIRFILSAGRIWLFSFIALLLIRFLIYFLV